MGSTRKALLIVIAVLLMGSASWSQPQARITRSIDSRNMTRLQGVHPMARPQFDQGALAPSQEIQHVRMVFNRSAAQQAALEQLLADQQNPASPRYHQWLTPEQFAAQFGMSDADLARVKDWLTSQGFTIDSVSRGHSSILFSGPAGLINSGFNTELHQYAVNGELHFANATPIAIPSALSGVVAGIRSLNDFKPKPHARTRRVKPNFTSSLSSSTFLAPDDFASIYNLKALYAAGLDGTGQKIAVVGQTDLYSTSTDKAADITRFRSVSNLPVNPPQIILIPGPDPGVVSGDVNEASLDVEWAGAVARKATIIYVNAGTSGGVFDSLYYAIDNNVAPVISISYGLCEADETSFLAADEAELQIAAAQGQTVVGPSGDSGAADCDFSSDPNSPVLSATRGLAVDYPASSAYVTGVGGTTFKETAGITYWNTGNNVNQGSALFYIPEVAWNDTDSTNGLSATGGGVSSMVAKPTWQIGTGAFDANFRTVPDISFAASPAHDGFITCVQGDCQVCVTTDANCASATSPGYRKASDQTFDIAGGTSAGVPTFAGMVALINQKAGSPQGLINPDLYVLAGSSAGSYIFHDVTSGDNKVPCTAASKDCPGSGTLGYAAGTGYDQVTGLGSVDAYNLVSNWTATPAADFSVNFFNPSLTVRHDTSSNMVVTLRRQNGFKQPVTLICSSGIPGVTCSVSPSTVTPDAAVTVTVTSSTTAALLRPSTLPRPMLPYWEYSFGVAAVLVIGSKRSKRQRIAIGLTAIAVVFTLASCGAGSNGSSGGGTKPNLTLNPSGLTFSYQAGGTVPSAQNVAIGSTGSALSYSVTTTTSSGGNWLSATPAGGTTSGTESVSVNPSGLSAGTYTGTITFSSTSAANRPQSMSVTLNVMNPSIGNLAVSPSNLIFNYPIGAPAPSHSLTVDSSGSALNYSASAATSSGGNWLSVAPDSGTTSGTQNVSVNPSGLGVGTYQGTVTLASTDAGNSPQTVPVTLNVMSTTGTVTLTATSGSLSHSTTLNVTVN